MEASSGTTEFLSRVRDILIKPTSIRTYDDVLELKKHLKPMDFVNSLVEPRQDLARDGLTAMRLHDHDGPIWRSLDTMCMHFELKKYKKGEVLCTCGAPASKYYVVLGGSVNVVEEASNDNLNVRVDDIDDMIDQMEDDRTMVDTVLESFPKAVRDSECIISYSCGEWHIRRAGCRRQWGADCR